ncbi:MBL fold metallo-hydrolase [Paenibacillus sp. HB172176]|uniref:MBL fold metallo-hydrolase n=1 Tax=Paenibacillus sp. HB172176 TaxID=2493690 RepID=UPI00143A2DC1|nr:MBL fold metallo-hydrolase [Paenibacillus sp. HB172176]
MTESRVAELGNGFLQVKIPLPFSLKWVNSYIVPEQDGVTVIDPGLRTAEAESAWSEAMAGCGLTYKSIRRIIVTHQHPDHYGLAGLLQEKSGADVYLTRRAHAYTRKLWGGESLYPAELRELFLAHGMPEELMGAIELNLASFVARVSPQPKVQYLEAGGVIELGGEIWQLIDAPGHAFGALCFYQEEKQWMICGDQVLPRITPNISVVPGEERDPLQAFILSLKELREYPVKLALPGHRDPFADFQKRIDELLAHHERRLTAMTAELEEGPLSAFELCEKQFGAHLRSNPHNLRFAMSETLAHLFHLAIREEVTEMRRADGLTLYQQVNAL